jgi:N-dimethylarginine dimethylaminohydrolase
MPKQILMCPADFFGIEYEINAWMHEENQVSHTIAQQQWQQVYDIYTTQLGWKVQLATPVKHLPDMVFATDCCLMIDGKVLLSNFRYPERQPESAHYKEWFEAAIKYWPAMASGRTPKRLRKLKITLVWKWCRSKS